MREIKLRAWHKTANEMLNEEYPGAALKWKHEGQPLEIMQFTGLYDKNKNPIYEGDILSVKSFPRSPSGGFYCDDFGHQPDSGRVVTFNKGEWMANTDSLWSILNLRINHDYEVIGNIYENPDLLTDKSTPH